MDLKQLLNRQTYDETAGEKVDVEIELEEADKKVVSLESCVKIAKAFRDTLRGILAIMCEEIQKVKGNAINNEYATIDEVNNLLKENTQLTYLDNNYLIKAQIEEEYLNSYYDRTDIDDKFNGNYSKSELVAKLFHDYYTCDEIDANS